VGVLVGPGGAPLPLRGQRAPRHSCDRSPHPRAADEVVAFLDLPGPVPGLELPRGLDRRLQGVQVLN